MAPFRHERTVGLKVVKLTDRQTRDEKGPNVAVAVVDRVKVDDFRRFRVGSVAI